MKRVYEIIGERFETRRTEVRQDKSWAMTEEQNGRGRFERNFAVRAVHDELFDATYYYLNLRRTEATATERDRGREVKLTVTKSGVPLQSLTVRRSLTGSAKQVVVQLGRNAYFDLNADGQLDASLENGKESKILVNDTWVSVSSKFPFNDFETPVTSTDGIAFRFTGAKWEPGRFDN